MFHLAYIIMIIQTVERVRHSLILVYGQSATKIVWCCTAQIEGVFIWERHFSIHIMIILFRLCQCGGYMLLLYCEHRNALPTTNFCPICNGMSANKTQIYERARVSINFLFLQRPSLDFNQADQSVFVWLFTLIEYFQSSQCFFMPELKVHNYRLCSLFCLLYCCFLHSSSFSVVFFLLHNCFVSMTNWLVLPTMQTN